MNTKFKILWFEDVPVWFHMERMRIEDILKEHYLTPLIVHKDGDDFDINELEGNEYDLILMDYKLADQVTGDSIVAALRKNDILTDILFYSSEEESMLSAIRKQMPPIDGVYLTKRDHTIFTEKAKRLINKIVRRSEDVVNLRGFVLDNTSDFELRVRVILNICWQKFGEKDRALLTEKLMELLDRKEARTMAQIKEVKEAEVAFGKANKDDYLLSMADRLELLKTALTVLSEEYHLSDMMCGGDFKQYYTDKVSVYRNKLGHITMADKTVRIHGKEVAIDQNLHRLMRRNIAEVDAVIGQIETHITMKM